MGERHLTRISHQSSRAGTVAQPLRLPGRDSSRPPANEQKNRVSARVPTRQAGEPAPPTVSRLPLHSGEKCGLTRCTAFEGTRCVASGELAQVARKAKEVIDRGERVPVLIFDDSSSELIEVDFRGTAEDVLKRVTETTGMGPPTGSTAPPEGEGPGRPGRPKLGVVAREVTLLPRHWDWLNSQPGGASASLRRLVEEARRANKSRDRVRQAQEAAYRFMSAMAGNEPGFEEATRALFRGNQEDFDELVVSWPVDVRDHAKKLAAIAFQGRALAPSTRSCSPGSTA